MKFVLLSLLLLSSQSALAVDLPYTTRTKPFTGWSATAWPLSASGSAASWCPCTSTGHSRSAPSWRLCQDRRNERRGHQQQREQKQRCDDRQVCGFHQCTLRVALTGNGRIIRASSETGKHSEVSLRTTLNPACEHRQRENGRSGLLWPLANRLAVRVFCAGTDDEERLLVGTRETDADHAARCRNGA